MIFFEWILWLAFIIGMVVFIHECGHFFMAKLFGVKVEEFAFGFGKKIVSKKIGETVYRINILPLGGYVKLLGEEKAVEAKNSFSSQRIYKKIGIIIGGVVMNFLFAVLIFYGILIAKGFQVYLPYQTKYPFIAGKVEVLNKPFVYDIVKNSPAESVNFPKNVIIWKLNGNEVKNISDLGKFIKENAGKDVVINVMEASSGNFKDINVKLKDNDQDGVNLGVVYADAIAKIYLINYEKVAVISGILHSINVGGYNFTAFGSLIGEAFQTKSVKPVSDSTIGIVGLAATIFDVVKTKNISELFNLLGYINVVLAIVNILPIPALDGGYILFIIIEKIRGRKIAEKFKEVLFKAAFFFLIALGILIAVKDVFQFELVNRVIGFFKRIF